LVVSALNWPVFPIGEDQSQETLNKCFIGDDPVQPQ
jgi:hypothetical protein